jgi:hypothetical protein
MGYFLYKRWTSGKPINGNDRLDFYQELFLLRSVGGLIGKIKV